MSDLLQQAVASGQVSAAQIEKHQAAGELDAASELGKSIAVQMPPCEYPDSPVYDWSIRELKAIHAYAQVCAEPLRSELDAAKDTLQFVERWANHHGAKPHMTAEQALGCIQHHPGIMAITRSYSNGKLPETRNPWAELEAARAAQLIEVAHLKHLLSRYRNEIPAGHQPHMICHEVDAALFNTKEQNNG